MRGGKLVRVLFLAVIAVGIAKAIRVLRGPKAPQFTNHPTVDGGPGATPDAPLLAASDAAGTDATDRPADDDVEAAGPAGELAAPPAPDGILADPRDELAGELAAPAPTPELDAPAPTPQLGAPAPTPALAAPTAAPESNTAAEGADGGARWVAPVDGACPDGYPIKVKLRSGIYHVPGSTAYDRTHPDRCYATVEDAVADRFRPPKR